MGTKLISIDRNWKREIETAIKAAELNTSGEIRVHIESNCSGDIDERAKELFRELGMFKTEQRNGVLFYICQQTLDFTIIGDIGINSQVEEGFWKETRELMSEFFTERKMLHGLKVGIIQLGMQLKRHFPYETNDVNELVDDISFGE